jgi:hypothetical protein
MTATNGFKMGGNLINDPGNNLEGELGNLSKEELKERLMVAERVMKTLFQRNKELEDRLDSDNRTRDTPRKSPQDSSTGKDKSLCNCQMALVKEGDEDYRKQM